MIRDKFIEYASKNFDECIALMRSKGGDYGKPQSDIFSNFRNSEIVGVSSERGILVRIMDKISRISNLLDKDNEVKDEPLEDSIKDGICYLILLKALLKEKKDENENKKS